MTEPPASWSAATAHLTQPGAAPAAARCYRCHAEFPSSRPVCDRCGAVPLPVAGFPSMARTGGGRVAAVPSAALLSAVLFLITALVLTGVVLAVSRLTGGSDAKPPYSDVYGAAISTVSTQPESTQPESTQPEFSPTYPNYATDSAYPTEVDSSSATSGGYPLPTPEPSTDLSTGPSSAPVSGPPAEASADSWVVQLASIGAATSPSEVERRRSAAEARLGRPVYVLDSSDFASLRPGYFVLYNPGPYFDGTAALAVCTSAGLADGDCFGRYLSHDRADRPYACHQPSSPIPSRCEH